MTRYQPTRELLRTWDGVLGNEMYGAEGVETEADYWIALVYEIVREAAGAGRDADETAASLCTSLASLGLLEASVWEAGAEADLDLADAVMRRHGLSASAAKRLRDALQVTAAHWQDLHHDVRRLVRSAAHDMLVQHLGPELVPAGIGDGLGMSRAAIAARWGETALGAKTRWSARATEFAHRFDVSFTELFDIADELDRSCARLDGVMGAFMEIFCRGCQPDVEPVCVHAAAELGIDVGCPLLEG